MPNRYGYARVSTQDQNLKIQRAALKKAKCAVIFAEKKSGSKRDGREELNKVLGVVGKNDTLVVTRLDRLGRSLRDLANIAHELDNKGANLEVTEQAVNTSTPAGRAFFGMLATFAQFETDVRRERQLEGIEAAKAKGAYKGRRPSLDRPEIIRLRDAGVNATDIARELGVARSSVYRVFSEKDSRY